jgi:hypothetical protein
MQHDRAEPARHEGPVHRPVTALVSGEREGQNPTARGPSDHELFDRGDYVPLFLFPNPPSLSSSDAVLLTYLFTDEGT